MTPSDSSEARDETAQSNAADRIPWGQLRYSYKWIVVAFGVIGALALYLTAIGIQPFASPHRAFVLAIVAMAMASIVLGAGITLLAIDLSLRRVSGWRWWHGVGLLLGVLVAGALGYAAVALPTSVGSRLGWFGLGIAGLVIGSLLAAIGVRGQRRQRADPSTRRHNPALFVLAAQFGVLAGIVVVGLLIALPGDSRRSGEFDKEIPLISGIGGEYVALGDSYAAGQGLDPFNHNTRGRMEDGPESNSCSRSQRAFSQVLQFRGSEPSERFVACSGAVMYDIYHDYIQRADDDSDVAEVRSEIADEDVEKVIVHAQLDRLESYEDVRLVTVTIGGNDMLFARLVQFCLLQPRCLEQPFETGDSGPRFVEYPGEMPLGEWISETIGIVEEGYRELFPQLRNSFPDARILVIGYPYLFPEQAAGLEPDLCNAVLRRVSQTERTQIRELSAEFNEVMARSARGAGLEFVSPLEEWAGHEPCGENGEYTNGIDLFKRNGSFHPNEAGQRALAYVIATHLAENPVPPGD
jgi:hypothetical protein